MLSCILTGPNSTAQQICQNEIDRQLKLKRFYKKKLEQYERCYPNYPYSQLEVDMKPYRKQSTKAIRKFNNDMLDCGFTDKQIYKIGIEIHCLVQSQLRSELYEELNS